MTNSQKYLCLKAREKHILARGRYDKMPGALAKVRRKINNIKKDLIIIDVEAIVTK